jgi:uncharacterized membrane protein
VSLVKSFFWVLLLSMVPVLELRASIPVGCSLGLNAWQCAVAAIIGNMIPVPFIILFIRTIFDFLRKHWIALSRSINRLEAKAEKKIPLVQKYAVLGLALLVAIPLPGTGAWTGALVAAMLDIRLKRAIPSILLGVVVAAFIVTMISYGIQLGVGKFA